jgi:hypothetical protein
MPVRMARFDLQFAQEANRCLALTRAGESVRIGSAPGSSLFREFHPHRLESLYELAYLKIFCSWERFLEDSFLRYLCGHRSRMGQAVMVGAIPYHRSVMAAEIAMLAGQQFVVWYRPQTMIQRVRNHIVNGQHELIIAATANQLELFAAIRHRIAHAQENARRNFDNATMNLAARHFHGRAGAFLRYWDTSATPPVRWIETITQTLVSIANLIV